MRGYRKVDKMPFTILMKHQRVTVTPGKGRINPNLRESWLWEEMIDDCCKCR